MKSHLAAFAAMPASNDALVPGTPFQPGRRRASGLLLHPTSLPGRYGIGTFGAEARAFVDFLADAGQRVWQGLPLGPTEVALGTAARGAER